MPRRPRHGPAGCVYHSRSRSRGGTGRIALFRREPDFAAMKRVLLAAKTHVDLPLLAWVQQTVRALGLEHTVRPEGRPRRARQEASHKN